MISFQKHKTKIGVILVIVSILFFLVLFIVPFLNLESKHKVLASTVCFIAGEIFFWLGVLLLGKALYNKYKSKLNPANWIKRLK